MSTLTATLEAFNRVKDTKDYDKTVHKMLWDVFFLQSMMTDVLNVADKSEHDFILSDNGRRGMAMIAEHCADLTISAIGILPPVEGDHE